MEFIKVNDVVLPKIGLGTFSIPIPVLHELFPEALRLGYTLFDTAYKYQNEAVLGVLARLYIPEQKCVVFETKICAEQVLGNLRYLRFNAKTIIQCFQKACKRLQVDSLDVLMLHSTFRGYEKNFVQLKELQRLGKVKCVGICNISLEELISLQQSVGSYPDVVQCEVHPYFLNRELVDFCRTHGIVVEARSPLAHGDAIEEWGRESIFRELSVKYGKSIPQLVIKWIVQQDIIALPRTSNVSHLKENVDVFDFQLTKDEILAIEQLNRNQSFGFFSKYR